MTRGSKHLESFANTVLDHPLLDEVKDRVALKMLRRFRAATPVEREIINSLMDNDLAFFAELRAIVAENKELNTTERTSK